MTRSNQLIEVASNEFFSKAVKNFFEFVMKKFALYKIYTVVTIA